MKKLLALFIALLLLLGAACAEVAVPVPPPTQAELQQGFLRELVQFAFGTDLANKALSLDVTEDGRSMVSALLQQAQDAIDLNLMIFGTPVQVQAAGDALLISAGDALYRLPYETLASALSSATGGASGMVTISPEMIQQLTNIFRETLLTQVVSFEEREDGQHIVIYLTGAEIASFGDAVLGNPQLRAVLNKALKGVDLESIWGQLRSMLQGGQMPISLEGDIAVGGHIKGTLSGMLLGLTCNMDFTWDGDVNEFVLESNAGFSMNVRTERYAGLATCRVVSGDKTTEFSFTPEGSGWSLRFAYAGSGDTAEITAACNDEAVQGTLDCKLGGEAVTGEFRMDNATHVLTGKMNLPQNIVVETNGAPTENGYHCTTTVTQAGQELTVSDCDYRELEEMYVLEFSRKSEGEQVLTATAAYAKQTGAFSLRADAIDGTYLEGGGMFTEQEQSCDITAGMSGIPMARYVARRVNDYDIYEESFAIYEAMDNKGTLSKGRDFYFLMDKDTGAFNGHYRVPMDRTYVDVQGSLSEDAFKLRANAAGRISGHMDLTCMHCDDGFIADLDYADMYSSLSGNLTWTFGMKALTVASRLDRLTVSLTQDDDGLPNAFYLMASVPTSPIQMVEISVDREHVFARVNWDTYTLTGGFRDQNTYVLELIQNEGAYGREARVTVSFTADPNALTLEINDGINQKVYKAVLAHVDKTEVESLTGRTDAVEITQEMLLSMLQGTQPAVENAAP